MDLPTGKVNIGITNFISSKTGKTCLFVNKILNAENENPFKQYDILLKLNDIDLLKYYLQDTNDGIERIERLFGQLANGERKVTVSRKFEKKKMKKKKKAAAVPSDVEKNKKEKKNNRKKKAKTEGSVSSGTNSSFGGGSSLSTGKRKPAAGGSRKPSASGDRSNKDNQSLP